MVLEEYSAGIAYESIYVSGGKCASVPRNLGAHRIE